MASDRLCLFDLHGHLLSAWDVGAMVERKQSF